MEKIIAQNKQWIDETWDKIDKKLSRVAIKSRNKIPYTTINGVHDNRIDDAPAWWTNGFWGGMMWLMYIATKNEEYRITAETSEKLMDKALKMYTELHHDVGFMWNILSGVNYRYTGNEDSRTRFLYAASVLASRYNIKGKFIRAWNDWEGNEHEGWTIIDSMMNIPLLYRASYEIGDDRFKYIALEHANMTIRDHIRPDGSVVHIASHDPQTGELIETIAGQGYAVGSSWSRGQAWAIYGFVLSYIHTGIQEYLDTAKKVAHYFIACVCDDYLPKVDFRSPEEPVLYDSTAGACAACGLIEIAKCVPEHEKKIYINAAMKLLKAMDKEFCNWSDDEDAILMMGTERYTGGIHMPIIYGDYFFTEALYKLKGNEFLSW